MSPHTYAKNATEDATIGIPHSDRLFSLHWSFESFSQPFSYLQIYERGYLLTSRQYTHHAAVIEAEKQITRYDVGHRPTSTFCNTTCEVVTLSYLNDAHLNAYRKPTHRLLAT
jgi:hypothetical protein